MADKKWYYGIRTAEGNALFFIELTQEEADAIRKFESEQDNGPDEGYSGAFGLSENVSTLKKRYSSIPKRILSAFGLMTGIIMGREQRPLFRKRNNS